MTGVARWLRFIHLGRRYVKYWIEVDDAYVCFYVGRGDFHCVLIIQRADNLMTIRQTQNNSKYILLSLVFPK